MKKNKSQKQEEKIEVINEGSNQQKSVLPNTNNLIKFDSPSSIQFENTPFAEAFQEALGLNKTETVSITEGDEVKITCSFSEDWEPIRGKIILIEGNTVTLDSGWTWTEEEHGFRSITNGTQSYTIKSIGVIKNA